VGAGYKTYGLNRGEKDGQQGIWYREWAPGARVPFSRTYFVVYCTKCSHYLDIASIIPPPPITLHTFPKSRVFIARMKLIMILKTL
jgi:hypothetical protein